MRQVHSRRSYSLYRSCPSHKARLHFIEPFLDYHAIMDGACANSGQYATSLLSDLPARDQNGQWPQQSVSGSTFGYGMLSPDRLSL